MVIQVGWSVHNFAPEPNVFGKFGTNICGSHEVNMGNIMTAKH